MEGEAQAPRVVLVLLYNCYLTAAVVQQLSYLADDYVQLGHGALGAGQAQRHAAAPGGRRGERRVLVQHVQNDLALIEKNN